MTFWLMHEDEIARIEGLRERAISAGIDMEYDEETKAKEDEDKLEIVGGIAAIKIQGILTPKRIRWLDYFGESQTVYSDIESKVREAESLGLKKAIFIADSPGGDITGLYSAMKTIANTSMETETSFSNMLASAAYMLASQTGRIAANNELDLTGSVGVRTSRLNWDAIKDISNTKSPKKTPDVSTEKGVKVVQEELDDIYNVIVGMIADGRGVSVAKVNKDYGKGAVMTAKTALDRGMIDAIGIANNTAKSAATKGDERMDAKTLREEHRETYDAIFQSGVQAERDRVNAHLVAAEGGDLNAAHEAIKNGEGYSDLVKAKHDAFARNEALKASRKDDNPDPIAPDDASHDDEQTLTKKGLEAAVPGLVWEVM